MEYSQEDREEIRWQAAGKVIRSLEWDSEGSYWVMAFDDGSEISFRLMAELTDSPDGELFGCSCPCSNCSGCVGK